MPDPGEPPAWTLLELLGFLAVAVAVSSAITVVIHLVRFAHLIPR